MELRALAWGHSYGGDFMERSLSTVRYSNTSKLAWDTNFKKGKKVASPGVPQHIREKGKN